LVKVNVVMLLLLFCYNCKSKLLNALASTKPKTRKGIKEDNDLTWPSRSGYRAL